VLACTTSTLPVGVLPRTFAVKDAELLLLLLLLLLLRLL
jgi:hypothetical protein